MIERLDKDGNVTEAFYEYALECCGKGIEIWVDIKGTNGFYMASNFGNIKANPRIKINKGHEYLSKERMVGQTDRGNGGYLGVVLLFNGKKVTFSSHRIIAESFIPNPESKRTVNHCDGNKVNNAVNNLEWNTDSENLKHAFRIGLMKPPMTMLGHLGKDHPTTKKVLQYDVNGNLLAEFNGAYEAERITKIGRSGIWATIHGVQHTAGGFVWKRGKTEQYHGATTR